MVSVLSPHLPQLQLPVPTMPPTPTGSPGSEKLHGDLGRHTANLLAEAATAAPLDSRLMCIL